MDMPHMTDFAFEDGFSQEDWSPPVMPATPYVAPAAGRTNSSLMHILNGSLSFYELIRGAELEYQRLEAEVTRLQTDCNNFHDFDDAQPVALIPPPFSMLAPLQADPRNGVPSDATVAEAPLLSSVFVADIDQVPIPFPRVPIRHTSAQDRPPSGTVVARPAGGRSADPPRQVVSKALLKPEGDEQFDNLESHHARDADEVHSDQHNSLNQHQSISGHVFPSESVIVEPVLASPSIVPNESIIVKPVLASSSLATELQQHHSKVAGQSSKDVKVHFSSGPITIYPNSSDQGLHSRGIDGMFSDSLGSLPSRNRNQTVYSSAHLESWSEEALGGHLPPRLTLLLNEKRSHSVYRMPVVEKPNWFRQGVGWLVTRPMFDAAIAFVIIVDGALLGFEAENRLNQSFTSDTMIEQVINGLSVGIKITFTLELCMRFYGFGVVNSLRASGWIRFDSMLVLFAWCDIVTEWLASNEGGESMMANATVLRIFRLARVARAARLVVQFRTLWLLISGLKASLMTMMWTWLLIMTIGYIFAVFGMETIPPKPHETYELDTFNTYALENFGSLAAAMLTLLQVLTLDSIAAVYRPLIMKGPRSMGYLCAGYFLMFIFIVSVALMNLVTAVMVEGSLKQASEDKEAVKAFEDQRKKKMIPKLREMFAVLDGDGSGEVSWSEIESAPAELKDELRAITKTDDLKMIFELLDDDDSGSVQIDEFLEGILKASSGDVMMKLQMARLVRQVGAVRKAAGPQRDSESESRQNSQRTEANIMDQAKLNGQ